MKHFRVTISVQVSIPAPFVRNGVPDQLLLAKIAAFKVGRAGANVERLNLKWEPLPDQEAKR